MLPPFLGGRVDSDGWTDDRRLGSPSCGRSSASGVRQSPAGGRSVTGQERGIRMKLYFRHHDQGAQVFRMEVANRQRRIRLNRIATVTAHGDVVPQGDCSASEPELARIRSDWAAWRQRRDDGNLSPTETFMAELNRFTEWVASDATEQRGWTPCRTTCCWPCWIFARPSSGGYPRSNPKRSEQTSTIPEIGLVSSSFSGAR